MRTPNFRRTAALAVAFAAFNVDVKKMQIRTDVSSAGTRVGTFKVDPWLIGVGIGRRF